MLNPTTVNFARNYSRISVPSIFWDDPFRQHRLRQRAMLQDFLSDFWNIPDPFAAVSPVQRLMAFRMPSMNDNQFWQHENIISNPKDGFHVSLNVEHFSPNEINVKVIDQSTILIEARHNEPAGDGYVTKHFTRQYHLPDGFSVKDIVSTLSSDGILTVKVPPKAIDPQQVRNIHIQQTGSPARNLGQGNVGPADQSKIEQPNSETNPANANEPTQK